MSPCALDRAGPEADGSTLARLAGSRQARAQPWFLMLEMSSLQSCPSTTALFCARVSCTSSSPSVAGEADDQPVGRLAAIQKQPAAGRLLSQLIRYELMRQDNPVDIIPQYLVKSKEGVEPDTQPRAVLR